MYLLLVSSSVFLMLVCLAMSWVEGGWAYRRHGVSSLPLLACSVPLIILRSAGAEGDER